MEGKLIKWTNYFSGWKERIFNLKGPLLYYYYGPKEMPRGKIHLGLSTIINDESNDFFEINTGSNIIFLKANTKEERSKWVAALTKAKIEGERSIREILKKSKKMGGGKEEYKDLILPELSYDAEMEQLNTAVIRFKMDNKNLFEYLEKKNIKDPELKILLERYEDDFEILKKCVENFDPIEGNGKVTNNNEIKIKKNKKILRNSSYENLNENNINNNNNIKNVDYNDIKFNNAPRGSFRNNPNREEDDYSVVNDGGLKNETLICSGEEFFDMEDDYNNEENNYEKQIQTKTNNKKPNNYNNPNNIKEKEYNLNNKININNNNNNIFSNESMKFKDYSNIISTSSKPNKSIKLNKNKYYDPLYDYPRRTSLPSKKIDLGLNVWKIFKSAVGKDLSRFGVPVYFNEPLSSLQKFCEPFQYAHLLNTAAKEPNPYIRLAKSATFCIGQFVINNGRQSKFFNPLLYETYEYIDNQQNFRYMAEQVSHHPAISAYYAEGDGWNIYANTNAVIKFKITGRLDVNALGRTYITYTDYDDVVAFSKPSVVVRNLIIGTIDLDVEGKFQVTNEMGDICEVDMIPSTSGQKGNIHGEIKDIDGNVKFLLEGNWQDTIYMVNKETGEKTNLWKIIPSAEKEDFYFQPYTFDLNNLTEEMKTVLPPTDSRFRPDQRLIELQDIDKAADEKHRLEEEQRARAKKYKEEGFIPKPLYFDETYDDVTGELIYKYKGNYWDMRYKHQYDDLPKLF
jgi:hypothetical protein